MNNLPAALREQAMHCGRLGSPFMEQMLTELADHWPNDGEIVTLLNTWPAEDIGPGGASLPLRLAGGLHALVLSGQAPELAAVYPPNDIGPDLIPMILKTLDTHQAFLNDWLQHAPQTNELRRSAALIPAALWLSETFGLPFVLSELGASGGLNLMFDRYAMDINAKRFGAQDAVLTLVPDWQGPLPANAPILVAERRGTDLNPLNPQDVDDALRMTAYLWADQPDRIARTRAAMAVTPQIVDQADAADWLETRLAQTHPGHCHMLFHTVAWQYFPKPVQARARDMIHAAGAKATSDAPLAWVSMENDGSADGAALQMTVWPGGKTHDLGRADFHGRWVRWMAPQ